MANFKGPLGKDINYPNYLWSIYGSVQKTKIIIVYLTNEPILWLSLGSIIKKFNSNILMCLWTSL